MLARLCSQYFTAHFIQCKHHLGLMQVFSLSWKMLTIYTNKYFFMFGVACSYSLCRLLLSCFLVFVGLFLPQYLSIATVHFRNWRQAFYWLLCHSVELPCSIQLIFLWLLLAGSSNETKCTRSSALTDCNYSAPLPCNSQANMKIMLLRKLHDSIYFHKGWAGPFLWQW